MNKAAKLSENQLISAKASFELNGFLVLPRFFSDDLINTAQKTVDQVKSASPLNVVVDDLETGVCSVLGLLLPDIVHSNCTKINDLHLQQPAIRALARDKKLVTILWTLLEFALPFATAFISRKTAQGLHIDSLYMTPRAQKHLIAAWGALEYTHEDAEQLEYFPANHSIEPMKFKDGSYHASDDEKPAWECYIDLEITWKLLTGRKSSAQKGVAFIGMRTSATTAVRLRTRR
jgi:hypothetical protein